MGSNETATATIGGPRVIDVFDGNGAPSGPNYLFFVDADRSRTPSGIGLGAGSRLDRMRPTWSSPESSGSKTLGIMVETSGQLSTCPHRYPPMEAPVHAL